MRWSALVLLLAGCCRVGASDRAHAPDEYAREVERLEAAVPIDFTVVAAPPFVVVGDGPEANVRHDAVAVVAWAAVRLERDFFPREPAPILDVWLFASEESYLRNTSAFFGGLPPSPYGWFSPCRRALVMSASLGYGTLVHEMTHAFMAANFPGAPVWYDEGLASLFEQPVDESGHLRGATNWRLAGLQEAIRARRTIPLDEVVGSGRGDFDGLHYAEARYLLYWLQERGKLVAFHRAYVVDFDLGALREALGVRALTDAQPVWERFVAGLSFP